MARLSSKTSEILGLDSTQIEKLSDKELRRAVRQVNTTANARLKYLEERGLSSRSLAYKNVAEAKGDKVRFSVRGKSREGLLNELKASKRFLEKKTSTARGIRNIESKVRGRIKEKVQESYDWKDDEDFELTEKQWTKFWKIYNEAEKNDTLQQYGSGELQDRVMNEYIKDKRRGKDYIITKLLEREEEEYIEEIEDEEGYDVWGMSDEDFN